MLEIVVSPAAWLCRRWVRIFGRARAHRAGTMPAMTPIPGFEATQARTREQLVQAMTSGAKPKWLMFWGRQPQADGTLGKGCLSQWWPCHFVIDEVEYASAEHWMMASKARL